jgi:hypothetical protein
MKRLQLIPRNPNTRNKYNVLMLYSQNYFKEHFNSIYSLAQAIPKNINWSQLRIQPKLAISRTKTNIQEAVKYVHQLSGVKAKIGFTLQLITTISEHRLVSHMVSAFYCSATRQSPLISLKFRSQFPTWRAERKGPNGYKLDDIG